MAEIDDDKPSLKRALESDFPEIQKKLLEDAAQEHGQDDPYAPYWTVDEDGRRVLHASPDSWWLSDYDESKVILKLPGIAIMNTRAGHLDSASDTLRAAYGVRYDEDCGDCFTPANLAAHCERFPAGQFVAIRTGGPGAGFCVGMASNLRTSRPPSAKTLPWKSAIGDMTLAAHEPEGDWIYGVEMAVHPNYRGHGIGSALHQARFALAKSLKLRGVYLVGMLMGYRDQSDAMSLREYGERVMSRQIKDPTVTMQLNRGFRALELVPDYADEPAAGDAGVLLVWRNPDDAG